MDNKKVGETLKQLRGKMSREQVAKACNISVSALQMYENGERRPRDEIKMRIANFYGVNVATIFFVL